MADETLCDLLSVEKFVEKYPSFTKGQVRAWIFSAGSSIKAKDIGFGSVIRRIGGRVYLSERAFANWIDSLNQKASA